MVKQRVKMACIPLVWHVTGEKQTLVANSCKSLHCLLEEIKPCLGIPVQDEVSSGFVSMVEYQTLKKQHMQPTGPSNNTFTFRLNTFLSRMLYLKIIQNKLQHH